MLKSRCNCYQRILGSRADDRMFAAGLVQALLSFQVFQTSTQHIELRLNEARNLVLIGVDYVQQSALLR